MSAHPLGYHRDEIDDRTTDHATAQIASWAARLRYEDIPPEVVARAKESILDTIGVTIAGIPEPAVRIARGVLEADGARPVASQIGGHFRGSPEGAALLNGIAGHVLDLDNVSWELLGHPSVVLLPAALAIAEATGASGRRFLTGYIGGLEVMAKVARALGPAHYEGGWHMTATAGTIGAAMAVASILGSDAERTRNALAIAVSEAAGTRQNFGSMTKSFHVGHAARSGVSAARLAHEGFTGNAEAIEGRQGFFALVALGQGDPRAIAPALGAPYELASPGLSYKKFPACYGAHRGIQAALDLVERDGIDPAEITAVRVTAPATELDPLVEGIPVTGLQGKFSMAYAVAAAFLDRAVGFETFTDAMVMRPEAQRLLRLVSVEAQQEATRIRAGQGHVDLRVTTRDGAQRSARCIYPPGSPQAPLSRDELRAKLVDCAGALGAGGVDDLIAAVDALDGAPSVAPLVEATRPAPAGSGRAAG